MSLDLSTFRLSQLDAAQWRQPVTQSRRLNILKHRDEYLQIEHDNPNLIWLYTLMLEDEVELPHGEVISSIKQRLLAEEVLTPLPFGRQHDVLDVFSLQMLISHISLAH